MKKQLLETIHNETRAVPLPEYPDLDLYDGELSIVYGTEEKVTAALAQVIQLYPPETTIIIPTITEVSKNLVLKLIPNITCEMMTQAKLLFV